MLLLHEKGCGLSPHAAFGERFRPEAENRTTNAKLAIAPKARCSAFPDSQRPMTLVPPCEATQRLTEAAVLGALDELRSLSEELPLYQKQIQCFFALILDIDKAGREPSRQVMRYYHFDQPDQPSDPELFPFRLLTTRFEPVDGDTCAPVLYANTVADMISFSLQACVERSITVRRCKNCGRYFAQTGRVSAEYCDRTPIDGQSSCRAMGAFQQWTLKQADDPVFKVYRREYKRRFAWIKAGRISDSEFYAWSEQAREQKKRCDEGSVTAEDFQRWLKES